jgi:hypothetical protein
MGQNCRLILPTPTRQKTQMPKTARHERCCAQCCVRARQTRAFVTNIQREQAHHAQQRDSEGTFGSWLRQCYQRQACNHQSCERAANHWSRQTTCELQQRQFKAKRRLLSTSLGIQPFLAQASNGQTGSHRGVLHLPSGCGMRRGKRSSSLQRRERAEQSRASRL